MAGDSTSERELLDLLLEATTDGVMDWDLARNSVRYTDRWKMLLGYETSELVDTPTLWTDLSHPADLPRVREALGDHLENFWPFTHTWRMRHANGEYRWVLCRAVTARNDQAQPLRLVAVFSDITDRIRAEERHRALSSAIPDLLLRVRADGTLLDVKAPDQQAPDDAAWPVLGTNLAAWGPAEGWYQRVTACIAGAGQTRTPSSFEVSLPLDARKLQAEVRVVPSADDEAVCIVRDVTEQRNLQLQLMQAHKLESIGQLAAGIAHEINTPMQFIGDNITFVQEACASLLAIIGGQDASLQAARDRPLSEDELQALEGLKQDHDFDFLAQKVPGSLQAALEGVRRVAHIVSAMKEFSHPRKLEKAACDLNRELETTITISANVWKYVADVDRRFDAKLPGVPCHAGEINQVVLNLIVNAAHAIADVVGDGSRGKGTIVVSTAAVDGFAEIRVSDTGTGIPEKIRHRIFDPFFTSKEVGKGTGQGLAIARNVVVERHGGTLDFETEVGVGTTFIVRLPLGPERRPAAEASG